MSFGRATASATPVVGVAVDSAVGSSLEQARKNAAPKAVTASVRIEMVCMTDLQGGRVVPTRSLYAATARAASLVRTSDSDRRGGPFAEIRLLSVRARPIGQSPDGEVEGAGSRWGNGQVVVSGTLPPEPPQCDAAYDSSRSLSPSPLRSGHSPPERKPLPR